uniref:RusA family crossover junction endodeoxyribonuclease n=1 Tax=uncultured Allobacillus sp. TaxID=1638025 RepID=UPI00259A9E1D|nr:RusA family crossover junction endodeoxyribonuclease [uncultured Allobacillus sp.]
MQISFEIPGPPVAQGRPRAGKINRGRKKGQTVLYDPQESRDYKKFVSLIARHHAPEVPLDGPLGAHIKIYRQIPKSTTKKDRALILEGVKRPITKPDNSNYAKGIEDALNGIIYKDDSQIVDLQVSKFYSENPRVEVTIEELELFEAQAGGERVETMH